ncbi:hypothetical protein CKAN_00498100 [Cinnamomum micranthum f. kanehirae]|uniref:Uncharacterized protein n=1 Tax=Cinnamomum micranthum f. kanehirae TaxID=337451 RepID=A0A3S3M3P4_9MAGN|nr:hypothetical protein CKAN_00498100 [Cinnamomum micranthum f. kanehirae]
MGQALRRVAGRSRSSSLERPPTTPPPPPPPTNIERRPRIVPSEPRVPRSDGGDRPAVSNPDDNLGLRGDNVLEERDPEYDAMLNKMLGRVTTKPGGKLEMGEAFIVEKYNRPLPKLRTSKAAGHDDKKPTPPGTLNTAQLRHILLLHQGKADDHDGPMDTHHIAEKFKIDAVEVERILQFISLPPEDIDKKATEDDRS